MTIAQSDLKPPAIAAGLDSSLGIRPLSRDTDIRQAGNRGRLFAIDDVEVLGPAQVDAGAASGIVVVELFAGGVQDAADAAGARIRPRIEPHKPHLVAANLPLTLRIEAGRVRIVTVEMALLRRAVAGRPQAGVGDIRFSSPQIDTQELTDTWTRNLRFVSESMQAVERGPSALLADASARVLAATVLTCFQNDSSALCVPTGADIPLQLRQAMTYVEGHAGHDINVQDIASAVHLSARAVQYLFRRHLDITPSDYLRRVRLLHAHSDLVRGDHGMTTVGEIAARWGFSHTGRFAVLYRETYGQSPHLTLRE